MSNVGDNYFIDFDTDSRLPIFDIDDWKKFPIITHQMDTIYDYNKYYRERMIMKKNLSLESSETKQRDQNKERITQNTKLYLSIKKLFVFVLLFLLCIEFSNIIGFVLEPKIINPISHMISITSTMPELIISWEFIINIVCIILSIIIYIVQLYFFNSIDFITIIYIIISSTYIINITIINNVTLFNADFFNNKLVRYAFICLFSVIFGYLAYINKQDTIDYKLHYQHKKTQRLKEYTNKLKDLNSSFGYNTIVKEQVLRIFIYLIITGLMMFKVWND